MLKEQLEKRRKQIEKRVEQDRVERMVKIVLFIITTYSKTYDKQSKVFSIFSNSFYFYLFFLFDFIYFYFILAKMET